MKMDHKVFFNNVKPLFGGSFKQSQVEGIEYILGEWEARYFERTPPTQFSNVFSTAWHETNATMQPIREIGNLSYFTRLYDIRGSNPTRARRMGNIHPGDGAKFCGRGLVQLTWFANYWKATLKLRAMGVIRATDDFTKFPELVMRPDIATVIMFEGMEGGWFTGVSLDDTIDAIVDGDEHADFVKARRVINGSDRAEKIAKAADVVLHATNLAIAAV